MPTCDVTFLWKMAITMYRDGKRGAESVRSKLIENGCTVGRDSREPTELDCIDHSIQAANAA